MKQTAFELVAPDVTQAMTNEEWQEDAKFHQRTWVPESFPTIDPFHCCLQ